MMPFYGRFDYFRRAVESVLSQDDADWRLVIVDDVYPDEAPGQWAASIEDERVHYIRNDSNLGVSRNYRKCVDLATSEFCVIMGCDDVMLPNYVARMHDLIARFPHASMIQPGVEVIDGDGRRTRPLADIVKDAYRPRGARPVKLHGEGLAASLLRGNWTYFPSLVWRTALVKHYGFRLDLNVVQDLAMIVEILKNDGNLILDDRVAFQYRRHATSVSARTGVDGSKFVQERTLFSEATRDFAALGWKRASRAAKHHFSSRLHALSELPRALVTRDVAGRRTLASHVLGLPYPKAR
jgi:glycosyltransferase involved in cell wall biosynthesis